MTAATADRFAAYVAHELRTPLALQCALLELALAEPDADWRTIGEDVLRACRQQERLLEACLTLVRSQSAPRRCEPVDLAALARDALRAHDPGRLERRIALAHAWTAGDATLVDRLVSNLVSNAIRHNVAGGRIEVETRSIAGRAVLTVTNTGPAIPGDEVERLFRPFERLDTDGDGVGLGLAIVDAVAEAHDAVVTARARECGGLEIHVVFQGAS